MIFRPRTYFALAITALLLAFSQTGFAQTIKDPVQWEFSVKKTGKGTYSLIAKAQIAAQWHIYAMNPGGDGELIGTTLRFDKGTKLIKGPEERSPAHEEVMLDEHVRLHTGQAEIGALIRGNSGQKISGSVEYQACNDRMCLPPKTKTFSISLP
ncbi:MAG: hypothetical protein JST06_06565 [Bacteroidetes bacterium]|nr:hypothetical protein [Bacteroidota bacterium]MBS1629869.1 hypothetical protein [Bacteroidota bacterium]